jgi:uncharacterized membrane protein
MSEYLSKEEVKQWRSSLEKITLEEYAARLGKKIEEAKPTKDLVDIVLKGKPVVSADWSQSKTERLGTIAERARQKEKEISAMPFFAGSLKEEKKARFQEKKAEIKDEVAKIKPDADILREEVRIVFKKALTDREQRVFDYLAENRNTIVYAKDLASLLDLPRDYIYKYIKNLRAKIEGESLQNADKGGFILNV